MSEFLFQREPRYFAQVGGGVERLAEEELRELGVRRTERGVRGVHFECDARRLYRVVYEARLVGKVLAPLASFPARHPDELHRRTRAVPWEDLLDVSETFAIFANVSASAITHSQFAALRVKDGIVDRFRRKVGERPSVDRHAPDVSLALHLHRNRATIALELGGGALHRRGYRKVSGAAPMMETLAAALVRLARLDGEETVLDPMCGAGTIIAEVLMARARIPAAYLRERFGLERLPGFDGALWKEVRRDAQERIVAPPPGLLRASDVDRDAVAMTRRNLAALPHGDSVEVTVHDARTLPADGAVVLANPPYGVRLGDDDDARALLRQFGAQIPGRRAVVYLGDPDLVDALGERPTSRVPLTNGGLKGVAALFGLTPRGRKE